MQPFVYEALPTRVVFGTGTVSQLRPEVERLGVRRVLILSTPGRGEAQAHDIAALLGDLAVGVHPGAVMHTPVEATEKALEVVRELAADAVVAVGGGSTTGLGKAIALRTDLPQIVLPTTYAGSEMTPILGETRDGEKTTQRTPKVLPEVVIYDVDLTLGLPPAITATSGMNAMAHAVEALYATR
jgi:alcohol dehydrogenase class IV